MLKSYLKIAARNLWKQRLFSLINILGLATGIAFALLITAHVWGELQVNQELKNIDNQYIIQSKWKNPGMGIEFTTLGPLARALKEQYPQQVANYYRCDVITSNVSKEEKVFREGLQIGDSTLLTMFGFDLVMGNPEAALNEPFSLVLTTEKAQKYFNRTDVVGETLMIENFSGEKRDFKITGVLEKNTQNSVTHFSKSNDNHFFIPVNTLSFFNRDIDQWTNPYVLGFVELKSGVAPEDLKASTKQLLTQNTSSVIVDNLDPYLLPLSSYYLNSNNGTIRKTLFTLVMVALFILVMASANFINLSLSKANQRLREIGVRKVLGGMRHGLIKQFYVESTLVVLIATLLSFGIYWLARPFFSTILGKPTASLFDHGWPFLGIITLLIILLSLMAGTYPALRLSSLKPVIALNKSLGIQENQWLKKALIAFQFFLATIVLACALIISEQVAYFSHSDLGYDKSYIVSAQVPRDWSEEGVSRMASIRRQFVQLPEIEEATVAYQIPDGNNPGQTNIYRSGMDSTSAVSSELLYADEHYIKTYDIDLLAGKFFQEPGTSRDSLGIVINESQVKALGWSNVEQALNQQVRFINNPANFRIVGVIKDYHFGSFHRSIKPVVFLHIASTEFYRYLSFKLRPSDVSRSLALLEKQWSTLLPGTPFDYTFMDETLAQLYETESRLEKTAYTATVLSIMIALLGVFGLVAIIIQKRTKEIGIRKVVGASVFDVSILFLKDFLPIIMLAGIVACPIAYWIMLNWLNQYEYGISITLEPFVMTIAILGIIPSVLIGIQSIKAAFVNPIESLRQE